MTAFKKIYDRTYRIISAYNNLTIGVAAKSVNNIDYTQDIPEVRAREKQLLESITGLDKKNIIFLNQMHEDKILIINNQSKRNSLYADDADGFITEKPKTCLVIRTADCVPIFVFDSKKSILGAAHSGWRGTSLSISAKLVKKMKSLFGSEYQDLHIYILPSIGPESYTVNRDVANIFPKEILEYNNKIYLDLWQSIENSLKGEGIPEDNIFNPGICNLKNDDDFFSHRSGDSGRNLNFGFIKE